MNIVDQKREQHAWAWEIKLKHTMWVVDEGARPGPTQASCPSPLAMTHQSSSSMSLIPQLLSSAPAKRVISDMSHAHVIKGHICRPHKSHHVIYRYRKESEQICPYVLTMSTNTSFAWSGPAAVNTDLGWASLAPIVGTHWSNKE